ncbi:MAG: hypothetical protein IPK46_03125 [Saprospiraceae bacterium]|nr:hypothetical protein [Saprospiraceae bacterium]
MWKDKNSISSLNSIPLVFENSVQRNKICAANCKYFNYNSIEQWRELLGLHGDGDQLKIDDKGIQFDRISIFKFTRTI